MSLISTTKAINDALMITMAKNSKMVSFGLGHNDPKRIFGTTDQLVETFGEKRAFDVPTSENALTGIAIGLGISGTASVVTHQRLDFFLLAMDQLVNSAAKWYFMFGSQSSVPITIRLIIGKGWGQGPTHSQMLHSWFAHIPGLKVVMPTTPEDAKGLLLASIFDPNPVIFLEHRWLHNTLGDVSDGDVRTPIGKAKIAKNGKDITLVAMSYMTIEALHAANYLETQGISCEVIDLRTIKPLDWEAVMKSVTKTGRLLALDSGFTTGSVAGEIVARVAMEKFNALKSAPARLAMPDVPEPTSHALTKNFYIRAGDIAIKIMEIMNKNTSKVRQDLPEPTPHDVPGEWFKGPF